MEELAQAEFLYFFIQLCKTLHLTDNGCNHGRSFIKNETLRLQYNEKLRNKYSSGISFKTYIIKFFEEFFDWMTQKELESDLEMNPIPLHPTRERAQRASSTIRNRKGFSSEQIHYLKLHALFHFFVSLSTSAKLHSSWISPLQIFILHLCHLPINQLYFFDYPLGFISFLCTGSHWYKT